MCSCEMGPQTPLTQLRAPPWAKAPPRYGIASDYRPPEAVGAITHEVRRMLPRGQPIDGVQVRKPEGAYTTIRPALNRKPFDAVAAVFAVAGGELELSLRIPASAGVLGQEDVPAAREVATPLAPLTAANA